MKGKIHLAPIVLNIPFKANAEAVDSVVFVADRDYEIGEISESHVTAGSDGGSVVADVKKAASGTSIVAGTSVLTSTFNLKSTVNVPVRKTVSNGGISQTRTTRILSAGQQLGVDFTGTMTAYAGGAITIILVPLRRGVY